MNKLHPVLTLTLALGLLTGLTTGATVSAALRQDFGEPLVLWHLVLYGLSTGPRDKGLSTSDNTLMVAVSVWKKP